MSDITSDLSDIHKSNEKMGQLAVMLCYNEVSIRGQQATVHWMRDDNPDKQPVYEVHVGKNKYSSFKGRMFFEFIPEMANFREVPEAGTQRYSQMVNG